jgi:hypothetical protein
MRASCALHNNGRNNFARTLEQLIRVWMSLNSVEERALPLVELPLIFAVMSASCA